MCHSVSKRQWNHSANMQIRKRKVKLCCIRLWRHIGLWDVEAITFSLDNRLTDGGKVVSLTRTQPFTSVYLPGTLVLISTTGLVDLRAIVSLEGLGKLKIIHLIGTKTRDLPACSIVPRNEAKSVVFCQDCNFSCKFLGKLPIFQNALMTK
jgi:hypothetical protein